MPKRNFWIKLHKDFMNLKEIKALRRLPGGTDYLIIYLELLLKSIGNDETPDGVIRFDGLANTFVEELAYDVLDEPLETVKMALIVLERFGLITANIDATEYTLEYAIKNTGKADDSRIRVQKYRERQRKLRELEAGKQRALSVPEASINMGISQKVKVFDVTLQETLPPVTGNVTITTRNAPREDIDTDTTDIDKTIQQVTEVNKSTAERTKLSTSETVQRLVGRNDQHLDRSQLPYPYNLTREEAFQAFQKEYPKRGNEDSVHGAWNYVLGKYAVDTGDLVKAAIRYRKKKERDGTVEQFIKYPQNFLFKGEWKFFLPQYTPICPKCHGKGSYESKRENGERCQVICDCSNRYKDVLG